MMNTYFMIGILLGFALASLANVLSAWVWQRSWR